MALRLKPKKRFKVRDPYGDTMTIEGYDPPTDEDLDDLFSQRKSYKGSTIYNKPFEYKTEDLARKIIPQFTTGLAESDLPFAKEASFGAPIKPEDMPRPKGIPATLARGVGNVAPDLAMSAPFIGVAGAIPKISAIPKVAGLIKAGNLFRGYGAIPKVGGLASSGLGFGAYSSTKAALQNKEPSAIVKEGLSGAGQAMLFHGAGKVGASVIPKAIPASARIGSGLGGAVAGGATGGTEGAILGGGLGALYPSKRFEKKSPAKYAKEAIGEYRDILRPQQGEIKNIELKKGRNIDDFYKIAAEEGLEIKSSSDQSGNRLDTISAQKKIQDKINATNKELELRLTQAKPVSFDLEAIGRTAKKSLRTQIKNDLDYKSAEKEVDNYINASIAEHGKIVDGITLNRIKQGMWSAGYNVLSPTSDKAARRIGFIAKEAIERGYPNSDVKALNSRSGDFATLENILRNAHGRVVKGGQLGRMAGGAIGAIVGSKVPFVGPIFGAIAGSKVSKLLSSPELRTKGATSKAKKGGLTPSVLKLNPSVFGKPFPQGAPQLTSLPYSQFMQQKLQAQPAIRFGRGWSYLRKA